MKICELAGMTLIELADASDDLTLGRNQETTRAAKLFDRLPEDKRRSLLALIESMQPDKTD